MSTDFQQREIIQTPPQKPPRRKRKRMSCFFIVLIIIFSLIGAILSNDNNSFLAGVKNSYLVRQITHILSSKEKYLDGEKDDRINIVFLGMGGPGHNGPYLTDTIIIASYKPSTNEAGMVSLPRDMIVPISPGDYRKINSIYTIGKGDLVKQVLSETLDVPIHYYVAVDFAGFVKMVDSIGGIDVNVEKSFTDYQFPTEDYKYQEIAFQAGQQEMDGLTALRFARSRHGNNGEGSDFARIKRQQKIILAAKEKITSFNTLINPKKITNLFSLFNEYTTTDIEPWEAVKLIHMAKDLDTQKIATQSIDDSPGGYLKAGFAQDGAWILQPVTGNYKQIQALVKNILNFNEITSENAKIVVQNGTATPGLALEAVNYLTQLGHQVLRYGNANTQDKIATLVYDFTSNKPKTLASLEAIFQTKAQKNPPLEYTSEVIVKDWNITDDSGDYANLDFLVILGMDQIVDPGVEIVTTFDSSYFASSTATTTPTSTSAF